MGAGASDYTSNMFGGTTEEKVKALLPEFYIGKILTATTTSFESPITDMLHSFLAPENAVVSPEDRDTARKAWVMIMDDTSPEFIALKARTEG